MFDVGHITCMGGNGAQDVSFIYLQGRYSLGVMAGVEQNRHYFNDVIVERENQG